MSYNLKLDVEDRLIIVDVIVVGCLGRTLYRRKDFDPVFLMNGF